MSSINRTIARSIARQNMKKAGYPKSSYGDTDWFHRNWRNFAPHTRREKWSSKNSTKL